MQILNGKIFENLAIYVFLLSFLSFYIPEFFHHFLNFPIFDDGSFIEKSISLHNFYISMIGHLSLLLGCCCFNSQILQKYKLFKYFEIKKNTVRQLFITAIFFFVIGLLSKLQKINFNQVQYSISTFENIFQFFLSFNIFQMFSIFIIIFILLKEKNYLITFLFVSFLGYLFSHVPSRTLNITLIFFLFINIFYLNKKIKYLRVFTIVAGLLLTVLSFFYISQIKNSRSSTAFQVSFIIDNEKKTLERIKYDEIKQITLNLKGNNRIKDIKIIKKNYHDWHFSLMEPILQRIKSSNIFNAIVNSNMNYNGKSYKNLIFLNLFFKENANFADGGKLYDFLKSNDHELHYENDFQEKKYNTGIGPTLIGEAYLNFGFIGILILPFFLSIILNFFSNFFNLINSSEPIFLFKSYFIFYSCAHIHDWFYSNYLIFIKFVIMLILFIIIINLLNKIKII